MRFHKAEFGIVPIEILPADVLADVVRKEIWKWPARVNAAISSILHDVSKFGNSKSRYLQDIHYLIELLIERRDLIERLQGGDASFFLFPLTQRQIEVALQSVDIFETTYSEETHTEDSSMEETA